MCQRLVQLANAFMKDVGKCTICDKYYDINMDAESLLAIRCAICYLPSHAVCTSGLFMIRGKEYFILCFRVLNFLRLHCLGANVIVLAIRSSGATPTLCV